MTTNTDVHTCSYYCERPECVKRQRDELRDRMEAALAQQPAAVDAGLAQRIQALVGGVEVDIEAPLSADANATAQTHGAMLQQLEPQLQEQLAESEHAAAAQEAEIEALREEVDVLKAENARLRGALQAIVDEVSDGLVPYSSDSYLPAHLVEQARAVLPKENSND